MNNSIEKSFGCLILLAVPVLCFSFVQTGKFGIWVTIIAGAIGMVIGIATGKTIGIATGGKADNGAVLLGLIFFLLFSFLANAGMSTLNHWWSLVRSNAVTERVEHDSLLPSLPSAPVDLSLTYAEIEGNYEALSKAEWTSYKAGIVGRRILWSGIIGAMGDDSFNLDVGQNKLTRRVYVSDLPKDIVSQLDEYQSVEIEGVISQIDEFLGLKIQIKNVTSISTKPDPSAGMPENAILDERIQPKSTK